MITVSTISALRKALKKHRNRSIGFVPTMGALHEGHLSLIRAARKDNHTVVVSIFVNPKQFGPKEDLKKYPRPLKKDLALCRREGVDFVFCPKPILMYPEGFSTFVEVEGLSDLLCGKFRPGHFRGVATVVAKLFNIVQPDVAYFGQKDGQQASVIRQMVEDLDIPVRIKVMPTKRDKDGLALSSRNVYLNKEERKDAQVLSEALKQAVSMIKAGQRQASSVISAMRRKILSKRSASLEYAAVVDMNTLMPVKRIAGPVMVALAVRIGRTRLIDNVVAQSA